MIVCLVQARLESKRLPNKVLLKLGNGTVLSQVIQRLKSSKTIDKIAVIIPNNKKNDKLKNYLKKIKVNFFRGNPTNVLDRYYHSAKYYKAKIIVRITADDPLKDPKIIDKAVNLFKKSKLDYLSNCSYDNSIKSTFPEGIDVEVFSFECLKKIWKNAKKTSEKEHVTPYIFNNKSFFLIKGFYSKINYSKYRWTLDYLEDYKFIEKIYSKLYKENKMFYMNDVIRLINKNPYLKKINNNITRYEGYLKSLEKEK